ncbi:MAG: hypothetical protein RIN55_08150 [Tissierellaceae bacterium]|nr:hypothetical protein [Tissierellaceae bacterium]
MKTFIEKLKDFLYDSIDYLIIIAIIIGVVSVIGWRLDVLFAKDNLETTTPPIIVDNGTDDKDNSDDFVDADPDLPPTDDEEPTSDPDIVDSPDQEEPTQAPTTVTITIPDGTLPSGIGAILESNGLVNSKNDFVLKAQDMGLDRKLRSGTFKILSNSSLEEIIKIIAKQI